MSFNEGKYIVCDDCGTMESYMSLKNERGIPLNANFVILDFSVRCKNCKSNNISTNLTKDEAWEAHHKIKYGTSTSKEKKEKIELWNKKRETLPTKMKKKILLAKVLVNSLGIIGFHELYCRKSNILKPYDEKENIFRLPFYGYWICDVVLVGCLFFYFKPNFRCFSNIWVFLVVVVSTLFTSFLLVGSWANDVENINNGEYFNGSKLTN